MVMDALCSPSPCHNEENARSAAGGHSGVKKRLSREKQRYSWLVIFKDVTVVRVLCDFFYRLGMPNELHCDQGTNFKPAVCREYSKIQVQRKLGRRHSAAVGRYGLVF